MQDGLEHAGDVFHVGVRVSELETAMADLGAGLGLTWATVVEREQPVWTPENGSDSVPLRFTYSCQGPQHVELLQGPPGSPWDGHDLPGLHHVGAWSDDVAAGTERLVAAGWRLELAGRAPQDGYGSMTYVRSPSGFLLELVSAAARDRMHRWWAGGDFS